MNVFLFIILCIVIHGNVDARATRDRDLERLLKIGLKSTDINIDGDNSKTGESGDADKTDGYSYKRHDVGIDGSQVTKIVIPRTTASTRAPVTTPSTRRSGGHHPKYTPRKTRRTSAQRRNVTQTTAWSKHVPPTVHAKETHAHKLVRKDTQGPERMTVVGGSHNNGVAAPHSAHQVPGKYIQTAEDGGQGTAVGSTASDNDGEPGDGLQASTLGSGGSDPMASINRGKRPPLSLRDRTDLLRIKGAVDSIETELNDMDVSDRSSETGIGEPSNVQDLAPYSAYKGFSPVVTQTYLGPGQEYPTTTSAGHNVVVREAAIHSNNSQTTENPSAKGQQKTEKNTSVTDDKHYNIKQLSKLEWTLKKQIENLQLMLDKSTSQLSGQNTDNTNMERADIKENSDSISKLQLELKSELSDLKNNIFLLMESQKELTHTTTKTIDKMMTVLKDIIGTVASRSKYNRRKCKNVHRSTFKPQIKNAGQVTHVPPYGRTYNQQPINSGLVGGNNKRELIQDDTLHLKDTTMLKDSQQNEAKHGNNISDFLTHNSIIGKEHNHGHAMSKTIHRPVTSAIPDISTDESANIRHNSGPHYQTPSIQSHNTGNVNSVINGNNIHGNTRHAPETARDHYALADHHAQHKQINEDDNEQSLKHVFKANHKQLQRQVKKGPAVQINTTPNNKQKHIPLNQLKTDNKKKPATNPMPTAVMATTGKNVQTTSPHVMRVVPAKREQSKHMEAPSKDPVEDELDKILNRENEDNDNDDDDDEYDADE